MTLAGRNFQVAYIENVDDLLDQLIAKGADHPAVRDEQIPYWADLWHAAIGLAEWILETEAIPPGTRVLEIGSGSGLPGMVAASMGARVTLSDYLSEALEFAEYVCLLNRLENVSYKVLDWRIPDGVVPVDVLIASDVAYENRAFEPLIHAFKVLVKPGGKILLSEPGRPHTRQWLNLMIPQMFSVEKHVQLVQFRGITNQVGIYQLTKRT